MPWRRSVSGGRSLVMQFERERPRACGAVRRADLIVGGTSSNDFRLPQRYLLLLAGRPPLWLAGCGVGGVDDCAVLPDDVFVPVRQGQRFGAARPARSPMRRPCPGADRRRHQPSPRCGPGPPRSSPAGPEPTEAGNWQGRTIQLLHPDGFGVALPIVAQLADSLGYDKLASGRSRNPLTSVYHDFCPLDAALPGRGASAPLAQGVGLDDTSLFTRIQEWPPLQLPRGPVTWGLRPTPTPPPPTNAAL
jgi:hypothetical protein